MATPRQVDLILDLCAKTGYDPDEYDLQNMSVAKASEIIEEMLKEV